MWHTVETSSLAALNHNLNMICYSSSLCAFGFICDVCFVLICLSALLLFVPREDSASRLWHFLGVFTYMFVPLLLFFFVRTSVISYVAFVLSLLVPRLFFLRCLGKAMLVTTQFVITLQYVTTSLLQIAAHDTTQFVITPQLQIAMLLQIAW